MKESVTMNMDDNRYTQESISGECKPLMDACTPLVYRYNAFRITGLNVDASLRDIKRRIDDLKHAEEMGDAEEEYSHAFALDPPPSLELIREAALRLQDPERRIIEEIFWFWPMKWGIGKNDPALLALANGDEDNPFEIWIKALSDKQSEMSIVSKHNLAVMYHMTALDGELISLEKNLTEDSLAKIDEYWRKSFEWWEELAVNEVFWSLVSARIRMIDDPRLTTGFARRMRATLPENLDKINALLAMQYIEKGKFELARKHIVYMKETHQGLDDVPKTLAMVTSSLQTRVLNAIEIATRTAEQQPEMAAQAAYDLFKMVSQSVEIIKVILTPEDYNRIDLCDAVAEAALACQDVIARKQRDWQQCITILQEAQSIAESVEMRNRIAEHFAFAQSASFLEPILQVCEQVLLATKDNPENAIMEAQHLLSSTEPLLSGLYASNVSNEIKNRAQDEIAGTLMQCAILYGNKVEEWTPCVGLLEESLKFAIDQELRDHISKNLQTVQHNARVFGNLKPISSAPSLSIIYGIGFKLYGATNHDMETGSFLSTHYFVFLYIPIFPICRYRVIPISDGFRFLGKSPLRTFDKWHRFISLALIALFAFYIMIGSNTGSTYRSSPSYSTPSGNVSSPSTGSALAQEIESGKARAKQMEAQLKSLDNRLDDMERQMNLYRDLDRTDEYNGLVPSYNTLLNQREALYKEYSSLVDEVNYKVNRYNSGYR